MQREIINGSKPYFDLRNTLRYISVEISRVYCIYICLCVLLGIGYYVIVCSCSYIY